MATEVRSEDGRRFSSDTAVTPAGPGAFVAEIHERWWVGRGPNGGYLAAIILRALEAFVGDPERAPRSLTVHFLAVPAAGPVRIECSVERAGRALSTLSARMVQGGTVTALALAAFSAPWPGIAYANAAMPEVEPAEALDRLRAGGDVPPFAQNFDMRWAIGPAPFGAADRALAGGWLRFAEPAVLDAVAAAAFMDAWIPSVFARTDGPVGAPTIDYTVHFRAALPRAGTGPNAFHLVRFSSTTAAEGFWEEDGLMWGPDGTLLAQSRQLALVLPPRG